ncbi:MAG: Ppx/GppA phosphatase family protein [Chloroflexota bacterium]
MDASSKTQRIAIIDLGSNTARMIVMQAVSGYSYRLIDEIREVVRLRQGMENGRLSTDAIARATFALRLFKRYCDSAGIDHIIASATSAVRDAENGEAFTSQVEQELELPLRILSGEEEAYYGALGVLNEVPLAHGFVVDIGGGSAQVTAVRHQQIHERQSVPLGALALTELFVNSDPIDNDAFAKIEAHIERNLNTIDWLTDIEDPSNHSVIGIGGTIRNLAKIAAEKRAYPLNTLHGFHLKLEEVEAAIELLRKRPLKERQQIRGLSKDRADIILPGALVIRAIMARLNVQAITISQNGLREGLFFEYFWQHLTYPVVTKVRRFGVLNMARNYHYQKAHSQHVRYLAGRLFNQLAPLHKLGPAERELLDAAALLHDLGTIISYHDHHKHSQTLIVNSGLPGFTPREIALVALLTRYHRQGTPSRREFKSILNQKDKEILLSLSAILRLSEYLERGRNGRVDDVTAVWDDHNMRITLIADEYPAVEIWEAEKKAVKHVEDAYGRKVILESATAP